MQKINPTPLSEIPENLSDLDIEITYSTNCHFCGEPILLMPCTNAQGEYAHHPVNLSPMGFVSQEDQKLRGGYQSHIYTCPAEQMAALAEKTTGNTNTQDDIRTIDDMPVSDVDLNMALHGLRDNVPTVIGAYRDGEDAALFIEAVVDDCRAETRQHAFFRVYLLFENTVAEPESDRMLKAIETQLNTAPQLAPEQLRVYAFTGIPAKTLTAILGRLQHTTPTGKLPTPSQN